MGARSSTEGPGKRDRDVEEYIAPPGSLSSDLVEARRELSRALPPSVFPASRQALLHEAIGHDAPAPTVELLARLPDGTTYATFHELWAALSRRPAREGEIRDDAAHDPLGGGAAGRRRAPST
jgi:Protein of unknown function (DUF2795)